jgi:hypothetical protein
MKNKIEITEAQLLLNQEVKVTFPKSRLWGQTGIVQAIMADGRTLDIEFPIHRGDVDSQRAFLDVTFVSEIQEPTWFAKTEQSLGPIANSVVQSGI